jgi:3D (Asp-Asp-Asp) domain-containing protein
MRMEATAFAQDAKPVAAGTVPHEGIVAADPAVLPLGSRIHITAAGVYNGIYTVTDTGAKSGAANSGCPHGPATHQ